MALLVAAGVAAGRERLGGRGGSFGVARLAAGLALLQAVGFTSLEAFERVTAGGSAGLIFHDRTVLIGLVVQVIVAVAGAALFKLLAVVVDAVWGAATAPAALRSSNFGWAISRVAMLTSSPASGGTGLRGPPGFGTE
jgi:hypothetical protein